MHTLFIQLLMCSVAVMAAGIWGADRLKGLYAGLSIGAGLIGALASLPLGLIVAAGLTMCATEIEAEGELPEQRLSWVIKRSGCGAASSDNYRVLVGRFGWWRHEIYRAYAWPTPVSVESSGPHAVRVILHSEDTPREGFVIPVSWLGRAKRPLAFYRGESRE